MAITDLLDKQADQSVALVGTDPVTGASTYYVAVDSDGSVKTRESGFSTATITRPTLTGTSAKILPANPARKYAHVINIGGTACYIQYGAAAVSGQGIKITQNGGMFQIVTNELFLGDIYGLGSGIVEVLEGT